jgi:Lon protease-like protein
VADLIPIFPLSHVLLPGMPLPLHIFEQRYRQLLVDVSAGPGTPSFGIVALTRGSEVGTEGVDQEPEFASVGTVAEVLEVQPYEDGASDLLTVGSRRFRILELVRGKPYLQARVDFLPEQDGAGAAELAGPVTRLEAEHRRLVAARTGRPGESAPPADPVRLSYHLAAKVPLSTGDRQQLLEAATAADRLRRTAVLLRREIALLRATGTIAVAPHVLQLYVRSN